MVSRSEKSANAKSALPSAAQSSQKGEPTAMAPLGKGQCVSENSSTIGKRRRAAKDDSNRSDRYDEKRQSIIEAAARVFNRMGYERASMTALAEEMGADRATLYYYFSSKEEVFDEVVGTVVQRNLEMVRKIEKSAMSPARKLRELIMGLMSSYGDNYPMVYIYIRENLSHVSENRAEWSKQMRKINRETTERVISIIEQGYSDGSFRKVGSAKVVAYGVFGIVGWTHRWFRPDQSDVDAEEIGKTYAEIFLAGIEAPY